MTRDEELFIETVNDVEAKLASGTTYDLIRTSGLLRHLVINGNPLVHVVNRHYRRKLRFRILETLTSDELPIRPKLRVQNLNPALFPDLKCTEVSLDEFLRTEWVAILDHSYSSKDIIQTTAHLHGGVHSGSAKTEKDELMEFLYERMWVRRERGSLAILREIASITLAGLEELRQSIRESESA